MPATSIDPIEAQLFAELGEGPPSSDILAPRQGEIGGFNRHHPPGRYDGRGGLKVWMIAKKGFTDKHVLRGGAYLFQVPPLDEFGRTYAFSHTDFDTVRRGQFSRPGGRQLATIQFQTMFLDEDWYWTFYGRSIDPVEAAHKLREVCESGTPFRLLCGEPHLWGTKWEVDMLATLRQLTVTERAGEVDCRYVDVQFTEYRDLDVPRRGKHFDFPLWHKIKKGDTLAKLSKHYYGQFRFWRHIHHANDMGKRVDANSLLHQWEKRTGKHKVRIPRPPKRHKPPKPGR